MTDKPNSVVDGLDELKGFLSKGAESSSTMTNEIEARVGLESLLERVKAGSVKALSIKQPYPHFIFHKGKDVENRDWPTRGRGWFLIHAGVSKSEIDPSDAEQIEAPRGGIVGAARIVDCVTDMDSEWFYGKYGFVLRDAVSLPLVPCRGQLSFFAPPPEVLTSVANALSALISQKATP